MDPLEIDGRTYSPGEVVTLVGCGKDKREDGRLHYARDLYTSTFFLLKSRVAAGYSAEWYVLSAKHELLHPYQPVGYYDRSLYEFSEEELAEWGSRVGSALRVREDMFVDLGVEAVVVLASEIYLDPLRETLDELPFRVETPLQGVKFHDQMRDLSAMSPPENETLDAFTGDA